MHWRQNGPQGKIYFFKFYHHFTTINITNKPQKTCVGSRGRNPDNCHICIVIIATPSSCHHRCKEIKMFLYNQPSDVKPHWISLFTSCRLNCAEIVKSQWNFFYEAWLVIMPKAPLVLGCSFVQLVFTIHVYISPNIWDQHNAVFQFTNVCSFSFSSVGVICLFLLKRCTLLNQVNSTNFSGVTENHMRHNCVKYGLASADPKCEVAQKMLL